MTYLIDGLLLFVVLPCVQALGRVCANCSLAILDRVERNCEGNVYD